MEAIHNGFGAITRFVNNACGDREPWKIVLITGGTVVIAIKLKDFLFQDESLRSRMKKTVISLIRLWPSVKKQIEDDLELARKEVHDVVVGKGGLEFVTKLPNTGLSHEEVVQKLTEYKNHGDGVSWKDGWVSGCVYSGGEKLTRLGTEVYGMFSWTNPLHPDVFPDIRQMEAEVVRMCCTLFNGGSETCGTTTSGGTESILLACLAYRNLAYSKGIKKPQIIASINVHAAFDKAADLFKMRLTKIPLDPQTMKVDVRKMKRAIGCSTCMLVGSAPDFPYGQIDSITEISELGVEYNVPVHVDSCLGGFLLPFMDKAGFPLNPFDFRLPGVTSISCDTHKYGFTGKGISVIMYRDSMYRKHQYSCATNWRGGIYATPTLSGSRAGVVIAVAWATLMYMGEEGYVKSTRDIVTTARYISKWLSEIDEISVTGEPEVCVVAIQSDKINIFQLSSSLSKRGWHLNTLQSPPGLHIAVTLPHTLPGVADRFINDMAECVKLTVRNPEAPCDGQAKIYGMAQDIPDQTIIDDVATMYLDAMYSTEYTH